ncbi:RelA/SpoT domain-containing protein [Mycobacterium neumannii]|uniref:RelA/SpoT domain-containing protein n=1 Tax=Mycobacterium neumannii TaxID=2048551 RepID=UPI003AB7765A
MVTRSRVDRAADQFAKGDESVDDLDAVRIFRDARAPILRAFIDDLSPGLRPDAIGIAGRIKRISSIVRKCRRGRTRISALEDLVGYRIVVRDLEAQKAFCDALASWPNAKRIRDYTSTPRPDGYRAVHIILEYDLADQSKGRIEIQVRTIWQHIWANTSEAFGLAVKEGGGPESIRNYLEALSISAASLDASGDVPAGWATESGPSGLPYIATFDVRRRVVRGVTPFSDMEDALTALLIRERADLLDAVLLLAESPRVLRITHIGLFPQDLIRVLADIEPCLTGDQTRALLSPA